MNSDLIANLQPGIAEDWKPVLENTEETLAKLRSFLKAERQAGHVVHPAPPNVLRAFHRPRSQVKVLIVGQDPYPTPGHAVGLSFSVDPAVRPLPRSLQNIYQELHTDMGIAPAATGDLSPWSDQGVMLLNRVLTVRSGEAGSHRGQGWETVTEAAIRALAERGTALVAILWGRDAQNLKPLLGNAHIIESAHPSPLSASRGFFGSRPFSRANDYLVSQGQAPINWALAPA